jgi:hypothetical protein
MDKEERDIWENIQYRMDAEGFHYCFESYSSWEKVKDKDFHELRLKYLEVSKQLEEYVNNKVESYE